MTVAQADSVRSAVGAVSDPELRRPIGELDMVREIEIDYVQGFGIARPAPITSIA